MPSTGSDSGLLTIPTEEEKVVDRNVPFVAGFAVASLVLGFLGVSILAIVFGFLGLSAIKKTGSRGRGMAITGIIFGFAWSILWGVAIFILATQSSHTPSWNHGHSWGTKHAYSTTDCDWWRYGKYSDNRAEWTSGCRAGYSENVH